MTRVVERCATCGVEHEARVDECEACGGALRYWCHAHSGEVGWLASAECRRCVEEKTRPAPKPRPAEVRPPARTPAAAPRAARPRYGVPPVPPVYGAAKPAGREPVYAPMLAHEWAGLHQRAVLGAMRWPMVVCVILMSGWTLFRAFRDGLDVLGALVDGVVGGVAVGMLVGAAAAVARLAWLKRDGGPLHHRYRPWRGV